MPFNVTTSLLRSLEVTLKAQRAIKRDQDILRAEIATAYARGEHEVEDLKAALGRKLLNDVYIATENNVAIQAYKGDIPSFPVRTNKNLEITQGVQEFFRTPDFLAFLAGRETDGVNDLAIPNISVNPASFWGTSRSTIYSAALVKLHQVLTGQDIGFYAGYNFVYSAPVPKDLGLDTASCYQGELQISYSGFAFGGNRVPSLYEGTFPPKAFMPHDGSSFVQAVSGIPSQYTFTTWDQIYFTKWNEGDRSEALVTWSSTPTAIVMAQRFDLVSLDDLHSGDVVFFRRGFSEEKPYGTSGNTMIVLEEPKDGNVLTIGANRDMPHIEGFLVKNLNLLDDTLKIYAHRLKPEFSLDSSALDPKLVSLLGNEVASFAALWDLARDALFAEAPAEGGHGEGAAPLAGDSASSVMGEVD